jgi:hypothetical protein
MHDLIVSYTHSQFAVASLNGNCSRSNMQNTTARYKLRMRTRRRVGIENIALLDQIVQFSALIVPSVENSDLCKILLYLTSCGTLTM